MKSVQFKIMNTIALLFMLTMNTLAVTLPIAGKSTGELSDMYPNLFVPAGFTFAIWSAIYLLLIGFVVNQWAAKVEYSKLEKVGYLFLLNALCNGAWIFAWHYEYLALSILIMLGILLTLILLYLKLDIRYFNKEKVKWLVYVPISVYFGWISVATIANFTTLLVSLGWNGNPLSDDVWATIMLIIAVAIGLRMLHKKKDVFFAIVIAWASYGIYSKRVLDLNAIDGKIEHTAYIAMFVLIIGILLTFVLSVVKKK